MGGEFRFGEFELDVAAYALTRAGHRIKLEKIPMDLLILLVQSAGTLVERKTIQESLWGPGVIVEHDSTINTAIRKIRQTLGDDVDQPQVLETVVGKGYRFTAPVEHRVSSSKAGKSQRRSFPRYCVTLGRQEFILDAGENLLGRDPDASVYIDHTSVSRRHARILIDTTRAILEDLKSRNGTFLEGRRIETPTPIEHGAIITLGAVTVRFIVLAGPASTRPMSSM